MPLRDAPPLLGVVVNPRAPLPHETFGLIFTLSRILSLISWKILRSVGSAISSVTASVQGMTVSLSFPASSAQLTLMAIASPSSNARALWPS